MSYGQQTAPQQNGKSNTPLIDLRSDTVTRPTAAQLAAIAALQPSDTGDDIYGEDPLTNELQEYAAELTGKEAALFVPTGTMGNLASVLAHCGRGEEVLLGSESHIFHYEAGGVSALGGVIMHTLPTQPNGEIPLAALDEAMRNRPNDQHSSRPTLVALENTHNRAGGRVLSLEYMAAVQRWAAAQSPPLPVHLDGARVFNAATSLGVPVKEVAKHVDTLTFCLSKGLGAPIGSLICGPVDFISKAHRMRKILGGAMRQVGVLAAAGLVALRETPPLLAHDHAKAQLIGRELSEMELVQVEAPDSNIVLFHLSPEAPPVKVVLERLRGAGILVGGMKTGIRAVTHVDVSQEQCLEFVAALRDALQVA